MPAVCQRIDKEANNGIKKNKAKQGQMHFTSVFGREWSSGSATENGTVSSFRKLWYDSEHSG